MRQVFLPPDLEGHFVRGLDLALALERPVGEPREPLDRFARQLEALQAGLVQHRLGEREANEGVAVLTRHHLQHFRRGHVVESAQRLQRAGEGIAMGAAAMRLVQRLGDRRAFGQYLAAPLNQLELIRISLQLQSRLPPAQRDALLVAPYRGDLLRGVGRAVGEQAVQQEQVEEAAGRRPDADRAERVEVHQAHFDVLDAALAQRVERALPGIDAALGADGAVELVLDLQQAGRQLAVVVVVADAGFRVGRIGLGERVVERGGVALEVVVAHAQRGLRVALVAERPHAQRGRVRRIHGAGRELDQLVLAPLDEARARRGRGAEQVDRQPGMAPEVADPGELLQAGLHAAVHAGDQLELRLAEIGGDVRVRERRAERRRVRRLRKRAVGTHAQALLLDAAVHSPESFRRESTQPILVKTHGFAKVTEFRLPNCRGHRYTRRCQRAFGEQGFASGGCSSLVLNGGRLSVRPDSGRSGDSGARRLHGGGDDPAARGTGAVRRGDPQSRGAGLRQGARRRLLERSARVRGAGRGAPRAATRGGPRAPGPLGRVPDMVGRPIRAPAMFHYAENAQYFTPDTTRFWFQRFPAGGARAEYVLQPPFGDDGHYVFGDRAGIRYWVPAVESFLARYGVPFKRLDTSAALSR